MMAIRLDYLKKVDYNGSRSEDYIRLLKISKGNGVLESMCIDIPSKMDTELDPAFFNFDAWEQKMNFERGEEAGENKLIQKMISKGISDEEIADTTEIDIKRIQELRASMC